MSTSTARGNRSQSPGRPGREARAPRKPPEPVRGEGRWLVPLHVESDTPGRLEISTRTGTYVYGVTVRRSGSPGGDFGGQLVGFQLENERNGEVYSIDTTSPWGWTCDCPDAYWRDKNATSGDAARCKHVVCLRAALDHLPKAA